MHAAAECFPNKNVALLNCIVDFCAVPVWAPAQKLGWVGCMLLEGGDALQASNCTSRELDTKTWKWWVEPIPHGPLGTAGKNTKPASPHLQTLPLVKLPLYRNHKPF